MANRPEALYPVIVNGDMSGSITSQISIIQKLSMMSYAYSWAGSSPVGTVSIQISNDYSLNSNGSVKNVGTWNTLPLGWQGSTVNSVPVTGNTGNGMIDIDEMGGFAIRTVYTYTSGTGTLQCTYCAKVA